MCTPKWITRYLQCNIFVKIVSPVQNVVFNGLQKTRHILSPFCALRTEKKFACEKTAKVQQLVSTGKNPNAIMWSNSCSAFNFLTISISDLFLRMQFIRQIKMSHKDGNHLGLECLLLVGIPQSHQGKQLTKLDYT